MKTPQNDPAILRYFAGLAEYIFGGQLGVADPPLVDYLSDLLVRFVRSDAVHRIRGITGRPLMSITEMEAEATRRLGDARRELHRHIGDFTLFWAGVYPEALRRTPDDSPSGQFESYCSHGKRSYRIASTIDPSASDATPSPVLHRLSERFELCVYGLREVRREWEEGGSYGLDSGAILLN
jgi:hypothetical protein